MGSNSYTADRSGGITEKDLLPCPFCGGKAAISHQPGVRHREADIRGVWGINCIGCGGAMPNCFSLKPIADAWNKRQFGPNDEVKRLLLDARHVIRDLRGCTDDECQEQNCLRVYQRCGAILAQPTPSATDGSATSEGKHHG